MPEEIHPIKIIGNWEIGYALDVHTVSSQFLGYEDSGKKVFDTERSKIGELLYRLKYKSDRTTIPEIVGLILKYTNF
ncbi:MAG: ComF family protein, partial [Thermodesulfobacteriota bacterium]